MYQRQVLAQESLDVPALRNGLGKELTNLPKLEHATGEIQLSVNMGRLLNLADKKAQKNGDKFISSESVLLAAMEDRESVVGK